MQFKRFNRRGFLSGLTAAVGLAGAGIRQTLQAQGDHGAHTAAAGAAEKGSRQVADSELLGTVSRFERHIVREGNATVGRTPHQHLRGIITPAELHFYENHDDGITPDIDPKEYRLLIHGMVDRPVELTLDDLKRLPSVSRIHYVECNGNSFQMFDKKAKTVQDIHGMASCSNWTGVPLSLLMKECGVQKGGEWLVAVSADVNNHAHTFPMAKAMEDGMVVYAQNGAPVRLENGYPLRLLLPGWSGRVNVKWLNRLKVVDSPYALHQEVFANMQWGEAGMFTYQFASPKAFAYHHLTPAKSIITFPSGGQKLPGRGTYEISGLAWSGNGRITKVEVSTDDGKTWKEAQLQDPVLPRAFTKFTLPWNWDGSELIVKSRSTDETGDVQAGPEQLGFNTNPMQKKLVSLWGSDTSSACSSFLDENMCAQLPRRASMSIMQSWKINRDGTVENLMPSLAEKFGAPTSISMEGMEGGGDMPH